MYPHIVMQVRGGGKWGGGGRGRGGIFCLLNEDGRLGVPDHVPSHRDAGEEGAGVEFLVWSMGLRARGSGRRVRGHVALALWVPLTARARLPSNREAGA